LRILILTQWFEPEPAFKGLSFAKEFKRRGYEVEVLTGVPNYPEGKIYKGYKIKLYQREEMDGISVIRVPLYASHDNSAFKRIINYFSFAFSAAFIGVFLVKKADIMYVYHPPGTIGFPAIVIRLLRGIPFVYDILDLWPDSLKSTGMIRNNFALLLISAFGNFIYRLAAAISVPTLGIKNKLIERGIPENKIRIIYNWAEEGYEIESNFRGLKYKHCFNGKFNVVFAGNMGRAQALDSVLDAAEILKNTKPAVQFVFIGGGVEVDHLKKEKVNRELDNVIFFDRVSKEEIAGVFTQSDALLVHLKNDPLFEITIPSKVQAYLFAGRPVIIGVKGDAVDLVKKAGAGLACSPESPESIVEAITRLYSMSEEARITMGNNGREYYNKHLSFDSGITITENIFQAIVNS
jgi:colanic acid biosynthesis glycosyl transferase WcaI